MTIAAVTLVVASLTAAVSPGNAHESIAATTDWTSLSAPASVRINTATPTPKPPAVKPKQIREGDQFQADTHSEAFDDDRADSGDTTDVADKPAHPKNPRQPRDTPPVPTKDDIDLNIGICGHVQPDGSVPGPSRCQLVTPDEKASRRKIPRVVPPRPQDVRWEQVVSETKDVLFPRLSVKVQPRDRTLVNLETIVYTDDSKTSTTTITLLGFPVVVEATPTSYSWNFGDGSPALITSTPGRPYPSKDITHKYLKRASVSLTLTTNYTARFNVAGTGWQYIEGTVPVTGPATPLLVREAVPVLVDPGR